MSQAVGARWVAARWALRGVLASYLDEEPGAIELRVTEHGKPLLAAAEARLRFNLSHSGELALIAIGAEREVGIDVERIRPRRNLLALARRALAPAEVARIESARSQARLDAFHAAWARREATAKCFGVGLHAPLPETAVTVLDLHPEPGYAAALAVAGDRVPSLRHFTAAPEQD
jgi:4'-phosphopantetheinyl transferase